MARLKSSTTSPFSNVPEQGRHIVYDRIDKAWYGFFDGIYCGCGRRDEVEERINAVAYNCALLEGRAQGRAQALAEVAA